MDSAEKPKSKYTFKKTVPPPPRHHQRTITLCLHPYPTHTHPSRCQEVVNALLLPPGGVSFITGASVSGSPRPPPAKPPGGVGAPPVKHHVHRSHKGRSQVTVRSGVAAGGRGAVSRWWPPPGALSPLTAPTLTPKPNGQHGHAFLSLIFFKGSRLHTTVYHILLYPAYIDPYYNQTFLMPYPQFLHPLFLKCTLSLHH